MPGRSEEGMTHKEEEAEGGKIYHETSEEDISKLSKGLEVELNKILEEKDEEIMELKRKLQTLAELKSLAEEKNEEDANNQASSLRRLRLEYESKLKVKEEELDEKDDEIDKLEQIKSTLEKTRTREKQEFQREIDSKVEEIEFAKQDNNKKLEEFENSRQAASKTRAQLEANVEEYKSQFDFITQAKEMNDTKVAALQKENDDLQDNIEEIEDEIEKLSQYIKQLTNQLTEAKEKNIDLKEVNRSLEEENTSLQEKLNLTTKKMVSAELNMVQKTVVERLDIKIEDLEATIEDDDALKMKQDRMIHRLKNQLRQLQDELFHMQDAQNILGSSTAKYERMIKDARNELEEARNQGLILKRKKEETEREVFRLEEELRKKTTENNSQSKLIRQLQADIRTNNDDSDEDEGSLADDMHEDSSNYSSLRGPNNALRRSVRRRPATFDSCNTTMPFFSLRTSQRRGPTDCTSVTINRQIHPRNVMASKSLSTRISRVSSKMASRQESFED